MGDYFYNAIGEQRMLIEPSHARVLSLENEIAIVFYQQIKRWDRLDNNADGIIDLNKLQRTPPENTVDAFARDVAARSNLPHHFQITSGSLQRAARAAVASLPRDANGRILLSVGISGEPLYTPEAFEKGLSVIFRSAISVSRPGL